jgi:hypothetical protein
LSALDIAICIGAFLIGEIALSQLIYAAHVLDRPY